MALAYIRAQCSQLLQFAKKSPPRYLTASLIVTVGGLLNGLDTGTIGPVTTMSSFKNSFGEVSSSLLGFIVSSIMLTSTLGSLFAGALSDNLGRPRAIAIGSLLYALGAGLESAAVNLVMFVVGRCVVGFGEGLFLSTLVVYVCEVSPPRMRGPLATMVQLLVTVGICAGFFSCYGTALISSSLSWRLPFALHAGIAVVLSIAANLYLPHSPRWLAHRGRKEEASRVWDKLGVSNAEREKDLLQNPALNEVGPSTVPLVAANEDQLTTTTKSAQLGPLARMRSAANHLKATFSQDARKPMLLGIFLMSMQQLSGIDGVIYYAPILFEQAGLASSATFLASGVSGILIFVFTILSVAYTDRWGRRSSTIYGGLVLLCCMVTIGLLYATDSVHATYGAGKWIVIPSIYIFAVAYSMTWAIGLKLYASEIQPIATRATATGLAQAANCITNFFVAFLTPILLSKSSYGIYFLFGGALVITVGVCLAYMPETKGKDLESIREAFGSHKASDMPAVQQLRRLGSALMMKIGRARGVEPLEAVEMTAVGSRDA